MNTNASNHRNTPQRNNEAQEQSRSGLGILKTGNYLEGWSFPKGSPINAQNISSDDNIIYGIGNPSPPFVLDEFENDIIYHEKGRANYLIRTLSFCKCN